MYMIFLFSFFFSVPRTTKGQGNVKLKTWIALEAMVSLLFSFCGKKKKDVNFEKWGSQLDEFKAVTSTRSEARANRRIVKIDRENVSINRPATGAFP